MAVVLFKSFFHQRKKDYHTLIVLIKTILYISNIRKNTQLIKSNYINKIYN